MKLNRLDEVFTKTRTKNRVIAKYLNKNESTISLWRNNKRQPSLQELREIAKLLRIDIRDLIEPTEWKTEKSDTYEDFIDKLK